MDNAREWCLISMSADLFTGNEGSVVYDAETTGQTHPHFLLVVKWDHVSVPQRM